jgi:hypothetical protein
MRVFARRIKLPFDVAVQTTQHADAYVNHEPNKKTGRSGLPVALMTSRNQVK